VPQLRKERARSGVVAFWARCGAGGLQVSLYRPRLCQPCCADQRWNLLLVVALKRDQSLDAPVGKILRQMGWVGAHLAKPDEEVKGLIISSRGDKKLEYALRFAKNVDFMTYEVDFRLKHVRQDADG